MIENSSSGLVMLHPAVAVTVTHEDQHQAVLARYAVEPGDQRRVAVALTWCTTRSGKHRGSRAVEVRLDGSRAGELTHAMSERYAALVDSVTARGGQPGCEAVVYRGKRGLEINLRLPRESGPFFAAVVPPQPTPSQTTNGTHHFPAPTPYTRQPEVHPVPTGHPAAAHPVPAARTSATGPRPGWIAAGVVGVLVLAVAFGQSDDAPTAGTSVDFSSTSTTTAPPEPSTTTPATTTPTTTTTAAAPLTTEPAVPAPAVPNPPPATPTKPRPAPKPTTKPAPPPVTADPVEPVAPAGKCNPNYTPCVPIASDVDCAGGSGNGPAYVVGPVRVIGSDPYDLDRDNDGLGCE